MRLPSHLELLQSAVDQNLELFGLFEDDIVLASTPEETNCRIALAVSQLPPTADMMYLEVCYEWCHGLEQLGHYQPNLLVSRAPSCTAAIVYTLKGARALLKAAMPIWDGIDKMLSELVLRGELEVCVRVCLCVCLHACMRTVLVC